METFELIQRLGVALAIGFLIGLERGWQMRNEPEGGRAAGLRTHALGGLLGGIWGALTLARPDDGLTALALAFSVFAVAVLLFRAREAREEQTFGMTTVVAAMLAFALGALAVLGNMAAAGAMGVATAALLAFKDALHGWLRNISWEELRSGLLLAAMSLILLPLLPDRTIDPWATFNPFELWLLTVMIAAISFAGYVAIKYAGDRSGIVMTGVAGGLASSTAVTVTLGEMAKEHPEKSNQLAAGALFSAATMVARVLTVVTLVGAGLLTRVGLPLLAGGAALLATAFVLLRGDKNGVAGGRLALTNPFELSTVLKFGLLLTAVTVVSRLLINAGGGEGVYLLAALSGIADVDAITLSMSRLAATPQSDLAANAILIVVAVNSIAKAVIGWVAGGESYGRRLSVAAAAAIGAGFIGYLVQAAWS